MPTRPCRRTQPRGYPLIQHSQSGIISLQAPVVLRRSVDTFLGISAPADSSNALPVSACHAMSCYTGLIYVSRGMSLSSTGQDGFRNSFFKQN